MLKVMTKLDQAILESLVESYGISGIVNELHIPAPLRKRLLPILAGGAIAAAGIHSVPKEPEQIDGKETVQNVARNPYNMSDEDYKTFVEKVEDVKSEINRVLKFHNKTLEDIKFTPEHLVWLCYRHNFDLPLAIAQLQCESMYGTTPRAKKTNSIFSVGLYDNGKNHKTYDSQDSSIEPYIQIMKKDYLNDGTKSVDDILKPGKFVTEKYGKNKKMRYASDPNYERKLKSIRDGLLRRYDSLSKNYTTVSVI